MCFLETGNGKATVLRFDYEHPPAPPQPNLRLALGEVDVQPRCTGRRSRRAGSPRLPRRSPTPKGGVTMSTQIITQTLDLKGLSCPLPIVEDGAGDQGARSRAS